MFLILTIDYLRFPSQPNNKPDAFPTAQILKLGFRFVLSCVYGSEHCYVPAQKCRHLPQDVATQNFVNNNVVNGCYKITQTTSVSKNKCMYKDGLIAQPTIIRTDALKMFQGRLLTDVAHPRDVVGKRSVRNCRSYCFVQSAR